MYKNFTSLCDFLAENDPKNHFPISIEYIIGAFPRQESIVTRVAFHATGWLMQLLGLNGVLLSNTTVRKGFGFVEIEKR